MNKEQTSKFSEVRSKLTGGKKYLEELTFNEIYDLINYIVGVEYSRNSSISKIFEQEDIVQDITFELLRDHETENERPTKSTIKNYIKQNMTVAHFSNTVFSAAKQWMSICCTREKSTMALLTNASLDAELDDEKSNLYNLIADTDNSLNVEQNLDYDNITLYDSFISDKCDLFNLEELINRLPKVSNKDYYIRLPKGKSEYAEIEYTYHNLLKLYICLYNRNEEYKIKNYIFETNTKKKVSNLDKVLNGFRMCLMDNEVLSAI